MKELFVLIGTPDSKKEDNMEELRMEGNAETIIGKRMTLAGLKQDIQSRIIKQIGMIIGQIGMIIDLISMIVILAQMMRIWSRIKISEENFSKSS